MKHSSIDTFWRTEASRIAVQRKDLRMPKIALFRNILFITMIMAVAGSGSLPTVTLASRAQPLLVQLAATEPQKIVSVIVQKNANATGLEEQVADLGGKVTKDLPIINAFAAEMTAGEAAELALSANVRWLSLDEPMVTAQTSSETSTSWATTIGTEIANQYTNADLMVDGEGLGPNTTFGSRAGNGKGTFGGFNVEAVPGNAVTKVEAVFYAYVNSSFSKDLRINAYINGAAQKQITVKTTLFTNMVGATNAGLVYVDITPLRKWQWADFYKNLELYVEQAGFAAEHTVSYDAIGLRITSAPGTDTSLDTLTDPAITDSFVDGSKQVNVYNQVIGATQLWNTTNKLQGKGVTVAVVDSGIYKTKDISGRVKTNVNFNPSYHDGMDRYGHGTFVAGIIASNGTRSNGKYIGVAPKVTLLNVRIADDRGMMYESDVIDSLQWIYNNKDKYDIRVANLSLNSAVAQSYHTSPLDAAVEVLWFNGIVVVASAGNNGTSTLYPPANDPFVITVGATDDKGTLGMADDTVATFSAYGVSESGLTKPELVAPGRMIVGLLPENEKLSMGRTHQSNRVDTTYFKMSGTSVSAPMVTGAVAILLQDEPTLTPDQVKYRLMATANKDWSGYDPSFAGAGYLDVYSAVYGTTTESANTGLLASQLLLTGSDPVAWNSVNWNSVNWNSVNWNSVNWNSVNWNSVNWNSVNWNSDYWEP
jgi:serine protease AprX